MASVFISYAREDKLFVRMLTGALEADNHNVWVDFDDIPFAVDWWDEITRGIEAADAVLFVISKEALESRYCALEVNHARSNNKRLVPLLYRPTTEVEIPPDIAKLNWVDIREDVPGGFDEAFVNLTRTLDTDIEASREHTRLLTRAREWERRGHNPNLLLRGDDLAESLRLLKRQDLTPLQREYLEAGSASETRRQLIWRFAWGFAGGFVGLGFLIVSFFIGGRFFGWQSVAMAVAIGEVAAISLGLLAMFAGTLPEPWARRLPVPLRIVLCLLLGFGPWWGYHWVILSIGKEFDLALISGIVGMAGGFILRLIFNLSGWLAFALTSALIYLPIYLFNNFAPYIYDVAISPLINFREAAQVLTVGLPMALMIALGANAQAVWREGQSLFKRLRQA